MSSGSAVTVVGSRYIMLLRHPTAVWSLLWLLTRFIEGHGMDNVRERGLAAKTVHATNRQLRPKSNAFVIVQSWLSEYEQSEQEANQIHAMDPTNHFLYGKAVPITTPLDISTFIVGGVPTETAASWMVMLLHWNADERAWQFAGCSGTLIASKYVLTAAHCVKERLDTPTTWNAVFVQAFAPFERGNGGLDAHVSFVESFSIHEDFTSTRFDKDVALIKMARPVNTAKFPTLQLADRDELPGNDDVVTIYGFGMTDEEADDHSDILREVDVPFVSTAACRQYYGFQITDDMVCAGLQVGGRDACNGDSGGPLVRKIEDSFYQVGIVSWGDGCARANSPGVYTSVPFHYQWIADTVCADADMQVELRNTLCRIETSIPTMLPTAVPTTKPITLPPTTKPTQKATFTLEPELQLQGSNSVATKSPTKTPTMRPTNLPTQVPTFSPSPRPPVAAPRTKAPSQNPTQSPIVRPTRLPSKSPTRSPTTSSARSPSHNPTRSPVAQPTRLPAVSSNASPTSGPTLCLSMDAPCLPWSGPSCCSGSCVEWIGRDTTFFTCFVNGKKGMSKKKKSKTDDRRLLG